MINQTQNQAFIKKGKELFDLGRKLEDCRDKLNALFEEGFPLSSPQMAECAKQFDRLHNAYLQAEAEYGQIKERFGAQCAQEKMLMQKAGI